MTIKSTKYYSENFNPIKRVKKNIKFIIVHYTGMKKESDAIRRLISQKSKVSCHYFIKNNGEILNMIPDLYIAWHAGKSRWKKYKLLNKYSIGIEINNPGHNNTYKQFSTKQINSLKPLLKSLTKKFNISHQNVLGHSDIAPNRKKDPGEKFPWKNLAKTNLCLWHNLKSANLKIYRDQKTNKIKEKSFLINLLKIGYSEINRSASNNIKKNIIKAFQRRFRQELINGKIDEECYLISKNLTKK